jgi:glycosyltransferase involved in cell wall biosynthesis
MKNKKALIVCPDYPYPLNGGNKVALHGYLCALRKIGYKNFDLISFDRVIKKDIKNVFNEVLMLNIPRKFSLINITKFIFSKRSLIYLRYESMANMVKIKDFIKDKNYDLVLIQHLYMEQGISDYIYDLLPNSIVIISPEVLEGRALRERASIEKNYFMKFLYLTEGERVEKIELKILDKYKNIFFYGKEDLDHYRRYSKNANAIQVNLGLDLDRYPLSERKELQTKILVFYGSFSWFPNLDALDFLLGEIWPYIKLHRSDLRLKIAGRAIPHCIKKYNLEGVDIVGEVASMGDFVHSSDIVLSPVRIGGGTRLKILEAMAWGRPVISTAIGLEGNDALVGSAVRIANSPHQFLSEIEYLLDNSSAWDDCVNNALHYIEAEHNSRLKLVNIFNALESKF